jgi:hypothetical protein
MRASRHLFALALVTLALGTSGGAKPVNEDAQFRKWLVRWMSGKDWADDTNTVYGYALTDLNGDGRREALVWISARGICGTGGCHLGLFRKAKVGWTLISWVPTTRPPVRVLASKTKGWNDLGVLEAGGGIPTPYEGKLRFDGKRYDISFSNRKTVKGAKGRVLITEATIPLYPDRCRKTQEAPGGVFGPVRVQTGKSGSC